MTPPLNFSRNTVTITTTTKCIGMDFLRSQSSYSFRRLKQLYGSRVRYPCSRDEPTQQFITM